MSRDDGPPSPRIDWTAQRVALGQTWPKHPLHQCGNKRLYRALERPRHGPGGKGCQDVHNFLCIQSLFLNHNYMQISEAFSSPVGVR